MTRAYGVLALLLFGVLFGAAPAAAQRVAPLEQFIKEVAYHWSGNDARSIAEYFQQDAQVILDTGRGTEAVDARHAAAALRSLFAERESVAVRPMRVTMAGARPPRGFGELAWSYRGRGISTAQMYSIYIGVVWTDEGWRISELRLIP